MELEVSTPIQIRDAILAKPEDQRTFDDVLVYFTSLTSEARQMFEQYDGSQDDQELFDEKGWLEKRWLKLAGVQQSLEGKESPEIAIDYVRFLSEDNNEEYYEIVKEARSIANDEEREKFDEEHLEPLRKKRYFLYQAENLVREKLKPGHVSDI
jgi:hypothetical protein